MNKGSASLLLVAMVITLQSSLVENASNESRRPTFMKSVIKLSVLSQLMPLRFKVRKTRQAQDRCSNLCPGCSISPSHMRSRDINLSRHLPIVIHRECSCDGCLNSGHAGNAENMAFLSTLIRVPVTFFNLSTTPHTNYAGVIDAGCTCVLPLTKPAAADLTVVPTATRK